MMEWNCFGNFQQKFLKLTELFLLEVFVYFKNEYGLAKSQFLVLRNVG